MIHTNEIISVMQARHSVKHYDSTYRLNRTEVEELLAATQTAPSSWNLQHWKFLVIDDADKKQQLLEIAHGQKQVADASVTIAILGDLQANLNAEPVYGAAVGKGAITPEIKELLIAQIERAYLNPQNARDEAILNASLAAMQLMLAAKSRGLDTCPMGGFDRQKFITQFAIPDRYIPVMLVVVGKAAKPAYSSARLPLDETIFWNQLD